MGGNLLITMMLSWTAATNGATLFVAPIPGDDDVARALTRAVESAALAEIAGVDVVTPLALDTKLEIDLAEACQTGDDTSCVVEFAQALGVQYVLRTDLTRLGDASVLTVSLFDGQRAALLGQGQRRAPYKRPDLLLLEVAGLVSQVAGDGGLSLAAPAPAPASPERGLLLLAATEIGGGALIALAGAAAHLTAFALLEPRYQNAQLSRDEARAWEAARPLTFAAPVAAYLVGGGLVALGIWTLNEGDAP